MKEAVKKKKNTVSDIYLAVTLMLFGSVSKSIISTIIILYN